MKVYPSIQLNVSIIESGVVVESAVINHRLMSYRFDQITILLKGKFLKIINGVRSFLMNYSLMDASKQANTWRVALLISGD